MLILSVILVKLLIQGEFCYKHKKSVIFIDLVLILKRMD